MTVSLTGVIRGKTIELDHPPGLPDGQAVKVSVEPTEPGTLPAGEGLRRAAGAWSDDIEGLEKYLDWSRQQRKQSRPPIEDP
jgi:hypothetical protein